MDETKFWQIIETAHRKTKGDSEEQYEAIEAMLSGYTPEEMLQFQRIFWQFHRLSYRADLWGAAYIMNGGASDDGFDYFRGWLIAQGRKVFEAALKNPDSLADILPDEPEQDIYELEDMLSVANDVWQEKTGLSAEDFYEQLGSFGSPAELGEFEWSDGHGDIDEEKGKKLYPKLWTKFDAD